ncbi:MAG: hypothetical protein ACUVX9_06560 [Anaerolineae bacterium]
MNAPEPGRGQTGGTVLDRFWVFCCPANSDYVHVQRRSLMTPAEAAFYLGVPNIIMVQAGSHERAYGEFTAPLRQYAIALRPLRRVAWSIVGSGGRHEGKELASVLELAAEFSNLHGVFMDDFFHSDGDAQLSLAELREVRTHLQLADRRLDLWVVAYAHMLSAKMSAHLEQCDVVSLWTWDANDLEHLPASLARLEEISPGSRKALGLYFWDYPNKRPVPLELMQYQCQAAFEWLKQGRIQEMIFLGNTVMDFDLPSVEWTREWIAQVGGEKLSSAGGR